MDEKLIHQYSDKILKHLNAKDDDESFYYATGDYRGKDNLEIEGSNIFDDLGIPPKYEDIVLSGLLRAKFIETHAETRSHGYRLNMKSSQFDECGQIVITREGRLFISNSSFSRERFKAKWASKLPNIISFASVAVALAALIYTAWNDRQNKQTQSETKAELLKKQKDFEGRLSVRLDSVLKYKGAGRK